MQRLRSVGFVPCLCMPCQEGEKPGARRGLGMQGHARSPSVAQHPGTPRSIAMGERAMECDSL